MKLVQVSVTTPDKERLATFYKDVFGFYEYTRFEKPDLKFQAIKIRKDSMIIEIIQSGIMINTSSKFSYHNKGWNMIGFEVENIENIISSLTKHGGTVKEGPFPGRSVVAIAFAQDPDGNGIELIEPKLRHTTSAIIKIIDWNRKDLWSTGILTADLEILKNQAIEGFWKNPVPKAELDNGLRKLGDIVGCPIPDNVAKRMGETQAVIYLTSLAEDYLFIKNLLNQSQSSWMKEWGQEEKRPQSEPLGEDGKQIPKAFRKNALVRGPGKYFEFSITRLLWINKSSKFSNTQLNQKQITELIISAKSPLVLQCNLLAAMADLLFLNKISIENIVTEVSKGICHEGFFKQNNCYSSVKNSRAYLLKKFGDKQWFSELDKETSRILNLQLTPLS